VREFFRFVFLVWLPITVSKITRNGALARRIEVRVGVAAALVAAVALFAWFALWPLPYRALRADTSPLTTDRDGNWLALERSPSGRFRLWTPLARVSPYLRDGFVQYEDRWFRRHPGVNPVALARAAIGNLRPHSPRRGGSTITMQVVRLAEPRPRTVRSKLIEMVRAVQFELACSKDELLELYLNLVPMGGNLEGIGAASWFYFGKDAASLSPTEARLLVAIPKSPERRRLDRPQCDLAAVNEQVGRRIALPADHQPQPWYQRRQRPFTAPHLAFRLRNLRRPDAPRTTIDPRAQEACHAALARVRDRYRGQGIRNAAAVVLDNRSGAVRAYVGGYDFWDRAGQGQIDAAAIRRSPGSALKPFLYAAGIAAGRVTPAPAVLDIPHDYDGYDPRNFGRQTLGPVSMRHALENSLNIPAVRLQDELGAAGLPALLRPFADGPRQQVLEHDGLTIALGGFPVTLVELAELYMMFANDGLFRRAHFLEHEPPAPPQRLLPPGTAFILADILSGYYRPDLPFAWEFSIHHARAALKTGTSFGLRDAWCVAFHPGLTVAVWFGNVDAEPAPALVGIEVAAPVAIEIFHQLTRGDDSWFAPPPTVGRRPACARSGAVPGPFCPATVDDWYLVGRSSMIPCSVHRRITVDRAGRETCAACRPASGVHEVVMECWPAEVQEFLRRNRRSGLQPAHRADCPQLAGTHGLRIVKPVDGAVYELTGPVSGWPLVPLIAEAGGDAERLCWFIDEVPCAAVAAGATGWWKPRRGRHIISVIDARGRSAKAKLEIH